MRMDILCSNFNFILYLITDSTFTQLNMINSSNHSLNVDLNLTSPPPKNREQDNLLNPNDLTPDPLNNSSIYDYIIHLFYR